MRKPTIRCSGLDRRLLCPGGATLEELAEERDGIEGDEGTELHRLTADRLVRELGAVGPVEAAKPGVKVDHALWIVDYCVREVRYNTPAGWSLEVEAALAYEFARFILSGHIDALALNPDATEAIGWDYKTGYVAVDAADFNEQVLGYIVLLLRAYPKLRKVTFYIVQPRNSEEDGLERVSCVVIEGDVLAACVEGLDQRICAALDAPMELNSGRKQCAWCPAAVAVLKSNPNAIFICPAIAAELDTMKLTLTPQKLAELRTAPNDGELGDFVISARTLTRPIEDAQALLHERIEKNGYVDAACGTRITVKTGAGAYKVPNPPAFYKALGELIQDPVKRAGALTFSMTRAQAVIAEVFDVPKTSSKPDVTSAESIFDAKLRPLTEQGTRKTLIFT